MMALQHSSVRNPTLTIYNIHANVGTFSLSYAAMPSFLVSVLFIDPNFIFKFILFNILVYSELSHKPVLAFFYSRDVFGIG